MPVEKLFAAKVRIVIGRAPDCDVVLPHPLVSRYHALLERRPEGLRLADLASVNGVSVARPAHHRSRLRSAKANRSASGRSCFRSAKG